MNGFSPLYPSRKRHRQLLTFAIASWLGFAGLSGLKAQDSEAPAAPPMIPSEEVPLASPTESVAPRPVKPFRKANARPVVSKNPQRVATKLIPTGPEDQSETAPLKPTTRFSRNTELIPTNVQPKSRLVRKSAAQPTIEIPTADEPGIQQVEAESVAVESAPLVPDDGLKAPALETVTDEVAPEAADVQPEVPSEEPAVPTVPNDDFPPAGTEEVPVEEPALDSAPALEFESTAPARMMPAAPFEPAESVEEVEAEPAPLEDRAANSQPVPTNFNIRRTAAADNQAYNDAGVSGFSPNDDVVHIVGKGESFWTIAKKHYRMGRYSAALAEYNKNRIPKPDRISPGMNVIVPPVATLEQKFGHMISGYVSPEAEAAAVAAKPGFYVDRDGQAFYRVGEGDTLSDIARNHLGRSSRWIQIVGLNKERLPNPDAMKPGMVLRLPNDASEMIKAE